MPYSKLFCSLFLCLICTFNSYGQNVGIGILDPANKLDVRSDGDTTAEEIVLGLISPTSQRPVLQFSEWQSAVPGSGMSIEYEGKDLFGHDNRLHIRSVTGLPRFTFTSGGWMGIGETTPHEQVEIAGTGRLFIGDGGGDLRSGLLIDANEGGEVVRLHPYNYGTSSNMDMFIPTRVGIGTPPDSSAILDVNSDSKGILVPRMTADQKDSIAGPANGLLVYQTDSNKGFWYYDGATWVSLNSGRLLIDADGDTKVQVEKNTDEDIIRFEMDSTERWVMEGARLEPRNSAGAVFIGQNAGLNDSLIFGANVAIGNGALELNETKVDLVAIGNRALNKNGMGATGPGDATGNTAIGSYAMRENTIGAFNTTVGSFSMRANLNGDYNTAMGAGALTDNIGGDSNSAIGTNALRANLNGSHNTATGSGSLEKNTSGERNCAFGSRALFFNISGFYNVAIGYNAMHDNTVGYRNTAVGRVALYNNIDRHDLVAIGDSSLFSNGTGTSSDIHATANSALGAKSLKNNTTGYRNTAIGFASLQSNATGYDNTALGNQSLEENVDGFQNTGIGNKALLNNESGDWNTGIGLKALELNTTGSQNTAVGTNALNGNTSGNFNTAVGYNADTEFDTLFNATAIGAGSRVSANNSLVLGNSVNVGIGTSSPPELLSITGTNARTFIGDGDGPTRTGLLIDADEPGEYVRIHGFDYDPFVTMDINIPSQLLIGVWGGTTTYSLELGAGDAAKPTGSSWVTTSDIRLKQDIRDYHPGLSDIQKIRPVHFRYNAKSGYDTSEEHIGVIAQELKDIAPYMVNTFDKDNTEYLAVNNSAMTYMLVNAVQELAQQNKLMQEQINVLLKQNANLDAKLLDPESRSLNDE